MARTPQPPHASGPGWLDRLRDARDFYAVELRPPRSGLSGSASIDAWIDLQHGVRTLARDDCAVLLTDNAVGTREEENLRHLCANADDTVDRGRLVPILTCLHSLDYCLDYAARAQAEGFSALAVLGGDRTAGIPRCVPHAWQLRERIRERAPGLALGGWANPHRDVRSQIDYLLAERAHVDFFLTQVVSSSQLGRVEAFLEATVGQGLEVPAMFGVFHYRSANPRTLRRLASFLPVPEAEVSDAFAAGLSPEELTGRTLAGLHALGVRKLYLSNLPAEQPSRALSAILDAAGRFGGASVRG